MTNLRNTFYEDKEMQYITNEYYLMKRNPKISILILIQHNYILLRQVVYKKAYDISRKGSHFLYQIFTAKWTQTQKIKNS